jgi:hypothetical protein
MPPGKLNKQKRNRPETMSKFLITKDFDCARCKIKGTDKTLEMSMLHGGTVVVVIHHPNGTAEECGEYTVEELRAIHWIISG